MYYIGLDVHKKTISDCVKDASGQVHREGTIGATRNELDCWVRTLPQPRIMAMEATIFTGWIYDHLLPHAEQVKVAHPLMLRAIAAAKKKNDRIDAGKIADCLRCDSLPESHMASTEIRDRRRTLRDTLVADTVGFNDKTWIDYDGHPHTDALHTIERFRRIDFGHIEFQITIDDPKAYTKPWTVKVPLDLQPDTELIESICENERDAQHMVGK